MRRVFVSLVAVVLFVSACGDDTVAQTTAPPATTVTAAPTTQTPATTPAATTTTAQPGTTAPSAATTTSGVDPDVSARIAGAQFLAGDWSGSWNNTTYGSTGPITVTVSVDTDAASLVATVDLGGSVFGAGDPDPAVVELDLVTGPPYVLRSGLLGEFTLDIGNDGSVEIDATDVPGDRVATMTVSGSLGLTGFTGTYRIEFEGGGGADGTIDVVKQA